MHLLFLRTGTASAFLRRRRRRCLQVPLQFTTFRKMDCGRNCLEYPGRVGGSTPSGNSPAPQNPAGVDGSCLEACADFKGKNFPMGMQASQQNNASTNSRGHERTPMSTTPYNKNTSYYKSGNKFSHSKRFYQGSGSIGLADIGSKQPDSQSASLFKYEVDFPLLSSNTISSRSRSRSRNLHTMRTKIEVNSEDRMKDVSSVQLECSPIENSICKDDESSVPTHFWNKGMASNEQGPKHTRMYPNIAAGIKKSDCSEDRKVNISSVQIESLPTESCIDDDESSLPTRFGKKHMASHGKRPKHARVYPNKAVGNEKLNSSEDLPLNIPFDICQSGGRSSKLSWHVKNGGKQHQLEQSSESIRQVLRPGMVLLKSYIKLSQQIDIVKDCRKLGLGPGGFYCPSYRDGAKLRLQMMCLGLDWDLETRKYGERRSVDDSKPPDIPWKFSLLVERAIQDSHSLISEEQSTDNVEDILPRMSPNICIVNFYTTNGRLGLHQDRDESEESLRKGLPVVSVSVGDSAEFLYGDHRDVGKAEKVVLESGDVLIFGGRSRHIFHGVTSIVPDSAPMALRVKSKLRPGRLNLTFRQN